MTRGGWHRVNLTLPAVCIVQAVSGTRGWNNVKRTWNMREYSLKSKCRVEPNESQ